MPTKILILGACGQIGTELTLTLRKIQGPQNVVASDIREGSDLLMDSGPFEILDATSYEAIEDIVMHYEIEDVYLMAAMLSATAEKFPDRAWNLNMNSLFNSLNLAKEEKIDKLFWPSSIAVFGRHTPKKDTPQRTIMDPSTVYGISKLAGERWCSYYHHRYGVDVRSVRYPGLISWKTPPGGGTTDYAVEIFQGAIDNQSYSCFLEESTRLPMMYIDDAIRATIELMSADPENIRVRSSYNLSAMSLTPSEICNSIRSRIPEFKISYEPDFRQFIADSWPQSIDDSAARKDWGWEPRYDLDQITEVMLNHLKPQED